MIPTNVNFYILEETFLAKERNIANIVTGFLKNVFF